ncbi:PREDICTED: tripartite motif-containing protein 5 [Myotis brandtii]|uniref:tripartite motif-containing protein 5 n=1 Tax=Myotis brandtii TaxID=109478 RepID=UPI000703D35D|nr:PREDICTED: tripartite motif-containing protein 5 [Myotis brandtii]
MASGILMNVKEEVTCPICLELLTEPMSLDCGHTFCQACITANNRESMIGQGESSCPVCRISYQPENLRPNRHVANIVEALREVKLSPQEEQKRDLCVHHGEKLLLFCQEDEKIICWLCERSPEHRGHHTFLIEEIAQKNKDVKGTVKRSKTFTLKKPKTLSRKLRKVFQAPDLRGILETFNELADVRRSWVHVTLDPPTDKSDIIISADRRQVKSAFYLRTHYLYQKDNDEDDGVLGSPPITSGKHYWEVDVSNKYAWVLGVYGEECLDSNMMDFVKQDKKHQHVWSQYQPKYGYCVIGLKNHSEYKAFVDIASSDSTTLNLYLSVPPRRVGVFLDYDAGTVSFFNITNHGFLIYKFSSCSFSQKMFPYFNPMKCTAPMTLCSPGS